LGDIEGDLGDIVKRKAAKTQVRLSGFELQFSFESTIDA
jgi:hypothetical protein